MSKKYVPLIVFVENGSDPSGHTVTDGSEEYYVLEYNDNEVRIVPSGFEDDSSEYGQWMPVECLSVVNKEDSRTISKEELNLLGLVS